MQDKCNSRHDASREQLFSLHTDGKASRQMKHIFRLLTKSDLTKDILEKELFILWPDNAQWYAAEIIKVSPVHSPITWHQVQHLCCTHSFSGRSGVDCKNLSSAEGLNSLCSMHTTRSFNAVLGSVHSYTTAWSAWNTPTC